MSKKIVNTTMNSRVSNKINIMYIIYLALIILPVYFKGAYFEQVYLPFIIGMSIFSLFYIHKNYKGTRSTLIKDDTDIFALLLILLYSLTFFYGVNKRSSLIEFAKYASYMSVFLVSRDMLKDVKDKTRTIDVIILGGAIVAIIGIGTMIGTWEYDSSYVRARLSSTFQYPNTLAAYAVAMYFLTMGRALMEDDGKKLSVYGGLLTIFFSTLIFTSSRGMWLLFPVILLVYFIILGSENKIKLFFYSVLNLPVSLIFAFVFMKYLEGSPGKLWGLYIVGVLISSAIFFLLGLGSKVINKIPLKAVLGIILVMAIGVGGLLYVAINSTIPLTLENHTDVATASTVVRDAKLVFPNTEYKLNIKGTAENKDDKAFAGRVVVYSFDEKGKRTDISTLDIVESGDYDLDYNFTTLEDTASIKLYFQNQMENTRITFEEANIEDTVTGDVNSIPLKYKYIPENIVVRVLSIGQGSAEARIIFSKDSLKLVKKNPVLGSGGDGWATRYRSVQSYPYWSKHVHNYFLQMVVEVGILGFLLFAGFLINLVYNYIKYKKKENPIYNVTLVDTLLITIIAILGHAAIDFDLSLVSVSITLWVLFGILASTIGDPTSEINVISEKVNKKKMMKRLDQLSVLLIVIALIISSTIYGGVIFQRKAVVAQENNDPDKIESFMEKAIILDPYNLRYKSDLINIYFHQYNATADSSYGNKARTTADQLLNIGKHDPIVQSEVAQAYLKMGLLEEALVLTENMVDMQPLMPESYLQKTRTYLSLFEHYISLGQLDDAKAVAIKGANTGDQLKAANEKSLKSLVIDKDLNFDILRLKYYSENFEDYIKHLELGQQLVYYYDFNLDTNNDGELDMLHTSAPEGSKIEHRSITEGEDTFIRMTNEGTVYGFKYVYPLSLEPDTTYVIELKARGNVNPDKFNLYAWSIGAADPNQGSLTGISLTDEWKTYSLEFTTDSDVVPGTQYIRIQHNGNDMGHIDIKEAAVFIK